PTEYEVWCGCLEGTVSLFHGAPVDYTHTARLQYEQRVSTTPEVWRLVTNEYLTRFRVDDYANEPADTLHLGTLAVQTTWSANNGWVEGYLHAGETWYNDYLPADVDVFRVDTGAGVYCVETEVLNDPQCIVAPMCIRIWLTENGTYGDQIAWTNRWNVYDENGNNHGNKQRVYFTLSDGNQTPVVQISFSDVALSFQKPQKYRVRVFRARPVILVHGIESNPKTATDPLSTMGHYKLAAPNDAALMPIVVYDFPWDSRTEDIAINSDEGLPLRFVQYVDAVYTMQNMPVVLIGHSMGGYLCRHYIKAGDRTRWSWCFLLGSPQYGSDIANSPMLNIINDYFGNTSLYNIDALQRGSVHTWEMHHWTPHIDSHIVCVAGDRNTGYELTHRITSYKGGLKYSDGIVPVSSANLQSISDQVRFHIMHMNHHRIGVFTNNEQSDNPRNTFCDAVYQVIHAYLD
ncbi:MAG: hypothetical protein NTV22_13495, partial [bacterium]|nr:hypothetical protein [bacterium]